MEDVNRDIRVVWERDYPHLIFKTHNILGNTGFKYKDYEFYLLFGNKSLCARSKDVPTHFIFRIEKLKSKYFLDLFNPSEEELVLFELEYGFEFPFCEKNKTNNIKEIKYGKNRKEME